MIVALGINNGAYLAEIFRGGLQSVRRGQLEAAAALALPPRTTFLGIVLPQAIRSIWPALTNQCIQIVLATSLAATIGVPELTNQSLYMNSRTFRTSELLLTLDGHVRGADAVRQPRLARSSRPARAGIPLDGLRLPGPRIPLLVEATLLTILLSVAALLGSIVIGLVVAVLRILGWRWVNLVLGILVDLVRGTPLLVQLLIWYLGSAALGIALARSQAAVVGLSVNGGAFLSEIVRGAFKGVPKGQREAALAIGLGRFYALRTIELPQAMPVMLPAAVSLYIGLIKDTSIAYIVGLHELLRTSQLITMQKGHPLELYLVHRAIYFALCFPLSRLALRLEAPHEAQRHRPGTPRRLTHPSGRPADLPPTPRRILPVPDATGPLQVMTVLGPIAPETIGNTLTHDHVLIDAFGLFGAIRRTPGS